MNFYSEPDKFFYRLITIFCLVHKPYSESCSTRSLVAPNQGSIKTTLNVPTYVLNTSSILHSTSEKFLSFSIDSRTLRSHWGKPSLRNKTLIRLLSYLAPGFLRIGGTEADRLVFKANTSSAGCSLNPNNTYFMTGDQWKEIYLFAKHSNYKVLFDFNVLLRKDDKWDETNARELLDFSVENGMDVDWQLGNEPNSFLHTFNVTLTPRRLAEDFKSLRRLFDSYSTYRESLLVGPEVTSPYHDGVGRVVSMPSDVFLQEFISSGGNQAVNAVTWHHYYLHSDATIDDFLDPPVFGYLQFAIDKMKDAVKGSGGCPMWITESGTASGGGVSGVTDRFVASFLFLDKLGVAAREGISLVVRQSLYAGRYSLIDHHTLTPNSDWWVAYVYKSLVAPRVLSITPTSEVPRTLRLYAHCSHTGSAVVFGVNLSNDSQQLIIKADGERDPSTAELYQLTAPALLSRKVLLNGEPLKLPEKSRPSLNSVTVNTSFPLNVAEYSIFFLHFDGSPFEVCRSGSEQINPKVLVVENSC